MESPAHPAAEPPAPAPSLATWVRRYLLSNFVVLLYCAFTSFLFRGQLSSIQQAGCAAAALGCWQTFFLACVLTRRRLPWLWPAARNTAIFLFVAWQLFFLFVRNPLDFWYAPLRDWLDSKQVWTDRLEPLVAPVNDATLRYGYFTGIDQNWRMFTPPLSRYATFLAARIEFAEGDADLVLSENEPDPQRFVRFGGWRQRKLEDVFFYKDPDLVLCAAYVRWTVRRWRDAHPDDPRAPVRVVLLRRDIALPEPDADHSVFPPATEYTVATFHPDGSPSP